MGNRNEFHEPLAACFAGCEFVEKVPAPGPEKYQITVIAAAKSLHGIPSTAP
jgi:hypothetical protein